MMPGNVPGMAQTDVESDTEEDKKQEGSTTKKIIPAQTRDRIKKQIGVVQEAPKVVQPAQVVIPAPVSATVAAVP